MDIVFLVYDSRSGSTLLAAEMAAWLEDVAVTPEVRFDALIRRGDSWVRRVRRERVVEVLLGRRALRNLALTPGEVRTCVLGLPHPLTVASVIEAVLARWVARTATAASVHTVFVKKGTHLMQWRRIIRQMPRARFVHIYRDPRAVINSKLRTVRPYVPGEVMAWGGAALAALRWRQCSSAMRAACRGASVFEIAYEEFLTHPAEIVEDLAKFVNTRRLATARRDAYVVPADERGIHRLVQAGRPVAGRSEAWRRELAPADVRVIEAVAGPEMLRRGYRPAHALAGKARAAAVLRRMPETTVKLLRHYLGRRR